mgnify:CR=1 FL=1
MQPPSGGCVLKLGSIEISKEDKMQPPSGGCVLKPEARVSGNTFSGGSRLRVAVC